MTKISNLPQDTSPTGTDFVPTYETTSGQTHKVLLSDIGEYVGSYPQNPYKFRARCTTAQTTPSSAFAKVNLNSKDYDTNNNFDATTNYRYTVPVTGYYQINGYILTSGNPGTYIIACLYKNGSILQRGTQINASGAAGCTYADLIYLTAGDYIELYMYTVLVTALDNSTPNQAYLSGYLVSVT